MVHTVVKRFNLALPVVNSMRSCFNVHLF